MELTRWGPWVPWAAQGCLNTTPSIRPALAVPRQIDELMDTHKHTFPTLRVKQALPHNTLRPSPQAHAISALVIIGHMRPIPCDPFDPSGSSERARGHHGHDRLHLKRLHGSQGTHPNGPHGVLSGPMGVAPWGTWVPWATTLPPQATRTCCECHHWPHATYPKGPTRPI